MNCQQFDKIIVNLACDLPMNDADHDRALAHAGVCPPCKARLARQQNAAAGLQALNAQEQTINAPSHIGLALQVAFEQQRASSFRQTSVLPKLVGHWWNQWLGGEANWRMATVMATAVGLVIFSLLATTGLWRTRSHHWPQTGELMATDHNERPESGSLNNETVKATLHAPQTPIRIRPHQRPKAVRRLPEEYGALLSLLPIAQNEADEFQQVVRMQIPRSTLRLWGLPVNEESASDQVSAKVYFSEDGVARAIRLHN